MNEIVFLLCQKQPTALKYLLISIKIVRSKITSIHGYLNLQAWHHGLCDQTEREKKRNGKNTTESSNGSRFKFWPEFWQIYNLAMERAFKKFIAPEQINMSFTFAYIECQAKQFSTHWNLLLFFPLCFLVIFSISLTAEFCW